MRRLLLLALVLFVFSAGIINAQGVISTSRVLNKTVPMKRCGTVEHNAALEAADPSITLKRQQLEEWIHHWIEDNQDQINNAKVLITIPIVVHVVWKTTAQNISDARVQEQINVLNRDFGGLNTHSMGSFSTSLKANTEIQFCLAQRKPDGTSTNGINRVQTTVTQFTQNDAVKYTSQGGADAWDPTKYMNLWCCNLGGGLLGYSQFPSSGINSTYGSVILYQAFGVTGASPPYNGGATATHEIGHSLNLFHIWGDDGGSCSGTDYCADVPNQADATYGSPTGLQTDACSGSSPGIMYMNFMDYTDDGVMTNFTPNQKARIQALFTSGGPLFSLTTSNGCTPVGGTLATLTTTAVTSITNTTATSGGNITNQGSSSVTARGVCWAITSGPVATGLHTTDGTGTGTFPSSITGLTAGTTYYVRAYATSSAGTAYGNEVSFTTTGGVVLATLTTTAVSAITNTTATSGGNITSQGSGSVTARGVCWATTQNPVVSGSNTVNGSGIGTFTSNITGLTLGTTYYVRAYATSSAGTAYGNQVSFTTTGGTIPTCDTTNLMTSGNYWYSYANGNNSYDDKAKANYYASTTTGKSIQTVYVQFILAKGTGNATVSVWSNSGTGGSPGAVLGSKVVPISTIISDVNAQQITTVQFTSAINLTGPCYVGVTLPTAAGDTVVLLADTSSNSTYNVAWEKWSDNVWYAYDNTNSWGIEAALAVFPVICSSTVEVPVFYNDNMDISVYPNPSQDFVYCELGKLSAKNVKLTVFSTLGKHVSVKEISDSSGRLKLDFSAQANGIYFIQFDGPDGKFIRKVSINK